MEFDWVLCSPFANNKLESCDTLRMRGMSYLGLFAVTLTRLYMLMKSKGVF